MTALAQLEADARRADRLVEMYSLAIDLHLRAHELGGEAGARMLAGARLIRALTEAVAGRGDR